MKKISRWFGGSHGILLTLYTLTVLFSSAILRTQSAQYLPKWFLLLAAGCALLCPLLLRHTEQLTVPSPAAEDRAGRKWPLLFFIVPFLCFLFKYIVYYPGGFVADSIDQYSQALAGQYRDWHPVIHTLLFYTLPLFLTGGWAGSIVLFQIILLSLTMSYAFSTLRQVAGNHFAVISLAFVLLNPETSNIAVFPMKDAAFGIGALLLISFTLRIFFSLGAWLRKPLNLVAFAVVLTLTALVRHNGILFAAPLLLAVGVLVPWKRAAALAACFAVLFCGVRFPMYSAMNVVMPQDNAFETLGLPLTIITACAKYEPETLDEETAEFVCRLIPQESLEELDTLRDFNAIKYRSDINIPLIGEYGAARIVPMALRCFIHAPLKSLQSLIGVTDVVYTLTDDYNYCDYPRTRSPQYAELQMQGIPVLQNLCNKVSGVMNLTFPWLFMYIGAMHFVLIVLVLAKCRFRKKRDWRKILVVLPVFMYNWGTALLLSGVRDSSRYFIYTFWVTPFLAALLLREEIQKRENA